MASAEREPITGIWGLCPQWGQSRGRRSGGRSSPEAERIFYIKWLSLVLKIQHISSFSTNS